jgi:hypothetical protein
MNETSEHLMSLSMKVELVLEYSAGRERAKVQLLERMEVCLI